MDALCTAYKAAVAALSLPPFWMFAGVDGQGATAADLSGNSVNLTLTNGPS